MWLDVIFSVVTYMNSFVLETDRLTLREFSTEDAPFILRLLNEPSFIRFIGDKGIRNLDDARQYILNGPMASYARNGFGLLLVQLKANEQPIGMCGLLKRETLADVDIGFAFVPESWNQGYAFESAAAVFSYAKDVLKLPRIVAIANKDNEASGKLLEKLGMRFDRLINFSGDNDEIKLFVSQELQI
jgi:[ribosomal protein S5]-alanine N-acetyltransferase